MWQFDQNIVFSSLCRVGRKNLCYHVVIMFGAHSVSTRAVNNFFIGDLVFHLPPKRMPFCAALGNLPQRKSAKLGRANDGRIYTPAYIGSRVLEPEPVVFSWTCFFSSGSSWPLPWPFTYLLQKKSEKCRKQQVLLEICSYIVTYWLYIN